ncbi:hypothetical protein HN371_14640 [Candidatus Poribacteria bacterium]|jgi:hypothetical protein|nr:hypothetical protein [Candidatus Poribacteria bacterium]MBT5537185.1 hypothetical protein [Candidatus Poribacteria bacterium]MBT7099812.1 hypothetical protein [Candidatus Poribacteria bacterium]MBT7806971.1 hypothetical protein [Candidatus Poribacteria bacterium]
MLGLCLALIHAAAPGDAVFVVHGVSAGALPVAEYHTWHFYADNPVLVGEEEYEMQAGEGNVYAPDVLRDGDRYRMWYGGQARDGHDRIHLAESDDGLRWLRAADNPAIDVDGENHVNDPSVVRVDGTYYMSFSVAPTAEEDEVHLATSKDGRAWTRRGSVIPFGGPGAWDSFKVGRPSLLHEDGRFRMWYDGTNSNPADRQKIGEPAARHVGLATSEDGIGWTPDPRSPLVQHSGAVDVARVGDGYVLLAESGRGTRWLTSDDGVQWEDRGLLFSNSGEDYDRYGQVTPMAYVEEGAWVAVYFGGAPAANWNRNCIAVAFAQKRITLRGPTGAEIPTNIRALDRDTAVIATSATGERATLAMHAPDGSVVSEQALSLKAGRVVLGAP